MEPLYFAFAVSCLFAVGFGLNDNFAFTDKVGQGNFAYAKLFAFADDGSMYRLTKRSLEQQPRESFAFNSNGIRNKFAKHRGGQDSEFAFAFAKRSASPFAKRFAAVGDEAELLEVDKTNPEFAKFAKFAKRSANENFAFVPTKQFA
uniref:Inhibitor_I29 domain-containing protein n=1 Tax=Panagrellus redivivus TaxID=6233 RepID=A0A7E4W3G2_PANRE